MSAGYEWDESLYAGSAAYYAIGRMPYPPELSHAIRAALRLDGSGRLLDVGCGPGSLTLLLAPLVREAVGIDADRDMIAAAMTRAEQAGLVNVSWRHMRAEELPGPLGSFTVVTFAQSFHWVEQGKVTSAVQGMLEPGGACVYIGATTHRGIDEAGPMPHPRPPWDRITELVAAYLGPIRRAGRSFIPDGPPADGDAALRAAGFRRSDRIEVPGGAPATRSQDEVVAAVFSLSSAAPHLFGDRLGAFERELRELLRTVSPDGQFCEQMREMTVHVWRS